MALRIIPILLALIISFNATSISISKANAETFSLWPLSETAPSHVLAVWININKLLITIAEENLEDKAKITRIKSLTLSKVEGKIPREVLGQVNKFRIVLDQNRLFHRLSPSSNSRDLSTKAMQPRTVFINSLLVLDSLQEWELIVYGNEISFAPYYRFDIRENIEPSDVFSQVVLATKRLELLIQ
ncbi:MAG: hypothetical protein V7776_12620 [Halopseudomonas aestusnigri]